MEADRDEVERLRAELDELRASRARLVLAADADRSRIERDLHGGVQQHLVALAVRVQLAEAALDTDTAAARALLEEIGRDVQDAVDEAALLAQRIHTPLLELGLAAALRSAAVGAGVPASVDVSAAGSYPPVLLNTVYTLWLDALAHSGETRPSVTVREQDGALAFDVIGAPAATTKLDTLRDRVDALGGTLTVRPEPSGGMRVSGSLPLSR